MFAKSDVRKYYMPYCLERLDDGRYVILNRNYKPLGMTSLERVDYAPWGVKLPGLTSATIAKISWDGSTDKSKIWIYCDKCRPTLSKKCMDAYLERVERLMKLVVRKSNR